MAYIMIGLVALLAFLIWHFKANGNERISKLITVVTILSVIGVLMYVAVTPPDIQISDNTFKITGPYGISKPLSSIKKVELRQSIPKILNKTNGMDLFGFGFRGKFKVDGLGVVKLYLQLNKGPYVFVTYNEGYFIINNNDSSKTEEIYLKLLAASKK